VTRMASISRAGASITFLRSIRSVLAPEAFSLLDADDLEAATLGKGTQITFLPIA
jgi:hypothetical protein